MTWDWAWLILVALLVLLGVCLHEPLFRAVWRFFGKILEWMGFGT